MFEKTLTDMVKGIRAHKKDEARYIAACLRECKEELAQNDMELKAEALLKLAYLQMFGHQMTWAAFNCVEAMSSPIFRAKRIGYLAATQSFSPHTEVALLTTNLIKKDMASPNSYEAALALNSLANIVTPDLSRDLVADVVGKLASPTPYVRKRGVLLLYKCILKYPDALRPSFPKLKEKLSDSDPSVVGTAVNVICELARKNPKNFLSLAPTFFTILTTTSNNWMLIKITKLFGSLTPLEPRLGKKLVQPLTNILTTTQAKSLMYEVVNTVSLGMTKFTPIVELGMAKLQEFLEDKDQNLKYLALLCMGRFIVTHPALVAAHQATIVRCLDDIDETIRMRALDLVTAMVSSNNIRDVVQLLLGKAAKSEGAFVQHVIEKVVGVCSADGYAHLSTREDFEWYLATLGQIARLPGLVNGENVASQLSDVPLRVADARPFATQTMVSLLDDVGVVMAGRLAEDTAAAQVISAASWVVGEYCSAAQDYAGAAHALLQPQVAALPVAQQPVYLHTLLKLCAKAAADGQAGVIVDLAAKTPADGATDGAAEAGAEGAEGSAVDLARAAQESRLSKLGSAPEPESEQPQPTDLATVVLETMRGFTRSTDAEVQERACFGVAILESYDLASEGPALAALFADELKPVGRAAQKNFAEASELDLETAIYAESEAEEEMEMDDGWGFTAPRSSSRSSSKRSGRSSSRAKAAEEEEAYRKEHAKEDPFYLSTEQGGRVASPDADGGGGESPPRPEEEEKEDEGSSELFALDDKFQKKKRKSKRAEEEGAAEQPAASQGRSVRVLQADEGDEEPHAGGGGSGADDALAVQNLDEPLGDDEVLPEIKAYKRATARYSGMRGSAQGGGAGMDWMAEATGEKKRSGKRKHKHKHKSKRSRDEEAGEGKRKSHKHKKRSHKGKRSSHAAEEIPDAVPDAPAEPKTAWEEAPEPAAEPAVDTPQPAPEKEEKKKKKKSKAKE